MAEEVKIKLIYANDDYTQELAVAMVTTVKDVKKIVIEQWPSSIAAVENVERLRLFAGGKELGGKDQEDMKTLKDSKLMRNPNFATPVHVQMVLKSAEPATEKETTKPSQCFCTVL
mmetsp:Transcript_6384/g.14063  ORF Transcript_6384/g.14063 Transcript_6384/m.14063 type:complete len:116 (-) Transcript_6384:129-476(-)|eukprot:CAMPEP_0170615244 /NCGR_PEP_ID=MMETSP0224-20130122/25233_1 /TAXON_ID=285029 /ORGANISM="Togula jolla, Strain CCCM 725" /LENGTH=115 /DNA_ID=CAMNT_0010940961 /DNA_START=144 /DNA_END=491 /DNA_ORIENTATION=+